MLELVEVICEVINSPRFLVLAVNWLLYALITEQLAALLISTDPLHLLPCMPFALVMTKST